MESAAVLKAESPTGVREDIIGERSGAIAFEASAPAARWNWPADCDERLSPGLEPLTF